MTDRKDVRLHVFAWFLETLFGSLIGGLVTLGKNCRGDFFTWDIVIGDAWV